MDRNNNRLDTMWLKNKNKQSICELTTIPSSLMCIGTVAAPSRKGQERMNRARCQPCSSHTFPSWGGQIASLCEPRWSRASAVPTVMVTQPFKSRHRRKWRREGFWVKDWLCLRVRAGLAARKCPQGELWVEWLEEMPGQHDSPARLSPAQGPFELTWSWYYFLLFKPFF